jgi:hypothetical protein
LLLFLSSCCLSFLAFFSSFCWFFFLGSFFLLIGSFGEGRKFYPRNLYPKKENCFYKPLKNRKFYKKSIKTKSITFTLSNCFGTILYCFISIFIISNSASNFIGPHLSFNSTPFHSSPIWMPTIL